MVGLDTAPAASRPSQASNPSARSSARSRCADTLVARGAEALVIDPLYDDAELRALGFEAWDGREAAGAILQADHASYTALRPADLPGVRAIVDGRGLLDGARFAAAGVHCAASAAAEASALERRDDARARVPVAVELRRARPAAVRSSAASAAPASRSTSTFQPASTVSTHSVVSRIVTHGTPAR